MQISTGAVPEFGQRFELEAGARCVSVRHLQTQHSGRRLRLLVIFRSGDITNLLHLKDTRTLQLWENERDLAYNR